MDLLENEIIEASFSFHRQRETIITWSDKEKERDLAVSFQNNTGALYTWQKICQILRMDPEQISEESGNHQEEDPFANVTIESVPKMADELRSLQSLDS